MEKRIFELSKLIIVMTIVAIASLFFFAIPTLADPVPTIIKQPESISVNYPVGGEFFVEVENPENVTYQWYLVDAYGQEFELNGTSAKTPNLIMPSTESASHGCKVFCVVTDEEGNWTKSEDAEITINNYYAEIPVLYLESYALLPGDSIDLAEVNLGSGNISFSENGDKVIFDNVNYNNEEVIFDDTVSPAIGLMYRGYQNTFDTITLELIGNNVFTNTFYQESSNGSGIPIDFYCLGEDTIPVELLITGDGTLSITGGTYLIRNNGKITIDADLTLKEMNGHFCDGIHTENSDYPADVTICPGVKINANINGTAIFTTAKIDIQKGSKLNIYSSAPLVGAKVTSKNILNSHNINIDGAIINIDMMSDPERFLPEDSYVRTFTAMNVNKQGNISIKNSNVKIHITDGKIGTPLYTLNNGGICAGEDSTLLIKNSNIDIDIDDEDAINADAIRVGGKVDIIDSNVTVKAKAMGLVHGIYCRDEMNLEDSIVDVYVDATDYVERYDDEEYVEEGAAHGIISKAAINISLKDNQYVKAVSKKGISIGVDYSTNEKVAGGFDKSYKPSYIKLGDNCEMVLPENAVLNRTSRQSGKNYIYTETPYNSKNTKTLEDTTLIKAKRDVPETSDTSSMFWILLLSGAMMAIVAISIKIRSCSK